jgi:hypothetical protein
MVLFRKITSITSHAELNGTYKDLYASKGGMVNRTFSVDGASAAAQTSLGYSSVKSGLESNKSIFQAVIPTYPSFGDANIHSLDFRLKIEDVMVGTALTSTPTLALYSVKDNIPTFSTDGHVTKVITTGKPAGHVTAVSSVAGGFVSDEEDFSGALNEHKYQGETTYTPMPRGIMVGYTPHLSRQDGWDFARVAALEGARLQSSYGDMFKTYSVCHTQFNSTLGSGDGKLCMIERVPGTHSPVFWRTKLNRNNHSYLYYNDNEISSKINFGTSETIESTDDYNNQVTPHNSFFNVVKQDRELMLETESSDPMLIGAGVSRFNSKNTFGTSGQSMEMFCHWAGDNRIDDGGSLGTTGSVSDSFQKLKQLYRPTSAPGGNFHSAQETFASYGHVPFPSKIFPSLTRDVEAAGNHNTMDPYRSAIEIDFNLDDLEAAVKYDGTVSADGKISMTKRAFVVTMGYYKPSTSDTLTTYINKHCDLSAYDTGENLDVNAGKPFWGFSFVNCQGSNEAMLTNGIKIIPSHVWKVDKSAVSGDIAAGYDLYVDEDRTDHYAGVAGKYTGGVNYWDPTACVPDKSWLTFKMLVTPHWSTGGDPVEWCINEAGTGDPVEWAQVSDHGPVGAVGYTSQVVDTNVNPDLNFSNSFVDSSVAKFQPTIPAEYLPHYGYDGIDAQGIDFWQSDTDYLGNADTTPTSLTAVWPSHLTIWLTNYANASSTGADDDVFLEQFGGEQGVTVNGAAETIRRATQSKVFVGGIRLKDFNYHHNNATISAETQRAQGQLAIGGNSVSSMGLNQNLYPLQKVTGYSVLSFGTDTASDFHDATYDKHIHLNNFATNLASNVAPHVTHGSISCNYSANVHTGETYFGNSFTEVNLDGLSATASCFNIPIGTTVESSFVKTSGTSLCDDFTKKGGIQLRTLQTAAKKTASTAATPTLSKREHHGVAAKILKVVDRTKGIYKVDTVAPFYAGEDDTYIAYLFGGGYTSTSATPSTSTSPASGKDGNVYRADIKLIDVLDSKHIQIKWNGRTQYTDDLMTSPNRLPYLWISPYKHWFWLTIGSFTYDSDEKMTPISPKSYDSALLLTDDATLSDSYGVHGATYNEYLYSDAESIVGSYENSWFHEIEDEGSIVNNQDYGFGAWAEDKDSGGYMAKDIGKPNTVSRFKMDKVVEVNSVEAGDTFSFLLAPQNSESNFEVVYKNNQFSETSEGPILYTNYEDSLPEAPSLSVAPDKLNQSFPKFKIQNNASDLWYQILLIDSKPINSQYSGGIFHAPMNESGSHGVHPSTVPKNLLYHQNNDAGTTGAGSNMSDANVVHDAEGLAGNCLRFDGSGDNVTYNPSSGNTFTDITSEFSMVAHIVPDTDGSSNDLILGQLNAPVTVYFANSTKTIVADFASSTGSDAGNAYVQLTSPTLQIDGETPICVIVTFDRHLKAGNCKLFIDGVLVDQSGLARTAVLTVGENPNFGWCAADDAYLLTSGFIIGHSFKGKIEEVVVYNKTIYPLPANADSFTLTKPLTDIENGSPVGYTARLFTKDYHNIRGSTKEEVACSSQVSWRKAGFRLHD